MKNSKQKILNIWHKWSLIPGWLGILSRLGYPECILNKLERIDDQFLQTARINEKNWREWCFKNLPRSELEWLSIFPEARQTIRLKVKELKINESKILEISKTKLKRLMDKKSLSEFDRFFFRQWILLNEISKLTEIRRHIRRLQFLIRPKFEKSTISQSDIELAKTIPIQVMVDGRFYKSGDRFFTLCPLHSERNSSFCVYPNNSFYCYGCNRGGSAIDLAKALYGFNFVEAVKFLLNSFGKSK